MLQEKKISSKINYDILKTLTAPKPQENDEIDEKPKTEITNERSNILSSSRFKTEITFPRKPKVELNLNLSSSSSRKSKITPAGLPVTLQVEKSEKDDVKEKIVIETNEPIDDMDEEDEEVEPEPVPEHSSLADMLKGGDADEEYYGYDEDY